MTRAQVYRLSPGNGSGAMPQTLQCDTESAGRNGGNSGTHHHHDVKTGQGDLVQTERFPGKPLQAIAIYSAVDGLAGNGEAEARVSQPVTADENRKGTVRDTFRLVENATVIGRREQAPLTVESMLGQWPRLRGQAGATLRAAGADHFAAIARRHAGPEAMGAGALQTARLKGAFHDRYPGLAVWFNAGLASSRKRRVD